MSFARFRQVGFGLAGVLALGAVLRLIEFLQRRPLWIDELMLGLNVGRRSFAGLLSPLDYDQHAPILFLWGVKATTLLIGVSEYSLRLLPFLGGLLLPWLIWRSARRLVDEPVALIAAALAAVSVPLVYYAGELKPYGTDAAIGAALLLVTARVREAPEDPSRWLALGVGGTLALLTSIPSPFVLVGVVLALVADRAIRSVARLPLAAIVAVWLLVALSLQLTYYAESSASLYLQRFWEGTYLEPGAPNLPARLYGFGRAILYPFTLVPDALPLRWPLLLMVLGFVLSVRRSGLSVALLLAAPLVAVAGASALARYPVTGRLLLFLAPGLFILAAVVLAELLVRLRLSPERAGTLGALLVLLAAAPRVIANGREPIVREAGREAAKVVMQDPKQPVYVLANALPAWAFYSTDWQAPDLTRLDRYALLGAATGPAAPNPLLPGRVPREQDGLEFSGPGRRELIGFRSGVAWREPDGLVQAAPDSGWASREAERIAAVARPYVWVYAAHWTQRELPSLRAELVRRGLRVVDVFEERSASALRVRSAAPLGSH